MLVCFTKVSDEKHQFSFKREDGSQGTSDLVSRSFLLHDFVHLALESEAQFEQAFYGLLALGTSLEELNIRGEGFLTRELELAEALTGPMQAVYNGRFSPEDYVTQLGARAPELVSLEFVQRVLGRIRKLMGHYRSLKYGETMEASFPSEQSDSSSG